MAQLLQPPLQRLALGCKARLARQEEVEAIVADYGDKIMPLATYQDKFRRLTSLHGQPLFLPRELR